MKSINIHNWTLLVLLLLLPFFFYEGVQYSSGRLLREIWDFGHFVFFGLLAFVLDGLLCKKVRNSLRRFLLILFSIIGCAAMVEIIQATLPQRSSSIGDLLLSLSGGLSVLFFILGFRSITKYQYVWISCGIIILSAALVPFLLVVKYKFSAQLDFPVLSDFESSDDLARWSNECRIKRVKDPVMSGEYSLQVKIPQGRYPGISLHNFPQNWIQAKWLQFSVYNPGESLILNFRIHDSQHEHGNLSYSDRYNGKQYINKGWNTIIIPAKDILHAPTGRPMDLGRIRNFRIFLANNESERVLYLDDVKLVLKTKQ